MNSIPFTFLIVFCVAVWEFGSTNPVAMSCDSCGAECARACGTRHFRSCCFNYVRKRSSPSGAFHPYSLNQMRYDLLYRQYPFGNDGDKMPHKNEQEQKPRKDSPLSEDTGSSQNEVEESGNLKHYYKPWKEDSGDIAVVVDNYDEHHHLSEPGQPKVFFDA